MMIWKKIDGCSNYSVSEGGQIRNDITGKILQSYTNNKSGCQAIKLSGNDGKIKRYTVANIVATAFIPNDSCSNYVQHLDKNPKNNQVSNLAWSKKVGHNFHVIRCKECMYAERCKWSEGPNGFCSIAKKK